jgi:ribonuclease HIII
MEHNIVEITYLECGHYFCKECLTGYYNFKINESGRVHTMKCPNSECKNYVKGKYVKELVGENSYQKFVKFMLNHEVATNANKKFCPIPGCENVIESKRAGETKIYC